jgi:hypothetical protein
VTSRAIDEPHAEFPFELLDLGTHPGLADPDGIGRSGEGAVVHDSDEVAQLMQFHD